MGIACDASECLHNDNNGFCEKEDIFISSAETGEPLCQEAEYYDDEDC